MDEKEQHYCDQYTTETSKQTTKQVVIQMHSGLRTTGSQDKKYTVLMELKKKRTEKHKDKMGQELEGIRSNSSPRRKVH